MAVILDQLEREILARKPFFPDNTLIGTENSNDAVLALMNKGNSASETVEQLLRLDEAGITYTTFYIIGMGAWGWELPAVKPRHGCSIKRIRSESPRQA